MTFESAAYVCSYTLKKVNGEKAQEHYRYVDEETGEVHDLEPEFLRCSLRPAIGKRWFEEFSPEVLQSDSVVARGREMKPPRYYDKLAEITDAARREELRVARRVEADKKFDEGSTKRLAAREAVSMARVSLQKRKL